MKNFIALILIFVALSGFSQKVTNTSRTDNEGFDWLMKNPRAGDNKKTLVMDFLENTSIDQPVGEIYISRADELQVTVTVTQTGINPTLAVDPESLDFLAPNGISFLNVFSNTNWTITDNMDWLGLNYEFPSGNQVVTVSVQMNNTGLVRSGEIVVETEDGSIQIVVPVTQQPFVEHLISLPAGWSGLSSYAIPTPPFIENVFSGIMDELIIALTEDEIYYPAYGINTIGMWNEFSGYKIKTNAPVDLEIYGSAFPDKTITVPSGWSMLPVISHCPVDVEDLFAPVVSDIEIVKDIAAYGLYWPAMGINNLGNLMPGKAYYVLTSNPVLVTFGECAKDTGNGSLTGFKTLSGLGLDSWDLSKPTTSSHSIALLPEAIQNLEKGSIIGAFDVDGNCFGITALDANAINVFGDDEFTAEKDGFANEDQIIFKLYQPSTKEEFELVPEFDFTLPNAHGVFVENGLSAITAFKTGNTVIAGLGAEHVRVYPNPSNGSFNISGVQEGAEITITDVHGQLVFSKKSSDDFLQAIDLQNCNPGVYMIEIKVQGRSGFHKMLVK